MVAALVAGIPFVIGLTSPLPPVVTYSPNPCGPQATAMYAPGLRVEVNPKPLPGTQACLDAVFTNTGTSLLDLGSYVMTANVTDAKGSVVYSDSWEVFKPNATLPPGGTWEGFGYWTPGSTGTYLVSVTVYAAPGQVVTAVSKAISTQ